MRYRNPFHSTKTTGPVEYDMGDPVVRTDCGRGLIFKEFDKCFHYVVNGRLVTMRAGRSKEILNELVSHILDGAKSENWFIKHAAEIYLQQAAA